MFLALIDYKILHDLKEVHSGEVCISFLDNLADVSQQICEKHKYTPVFGDRMILSGKDKTITSTYIYGAEVWVNAICFAGCDFETDGGIVPPPHRSPVISKGPMIRRD